MSASREAVTPRVMEKAPPRRLNFFERHLSLWVLLCMGFGVLFGRGLPQVTASLSRLEIGRG